MSSTELFALLDRAQNGDEDACHQVLVENTGLIWSIVKRYYGCGVETDDLYQLGCIGFIKAVKGFDLTYGTQFSTYAVPKIAGEIRRFLRDDGTLKVSRGLKEQAYAIKTVRNRLIHTLGREPTVSELAKHTGYTVEEVAEAELATSSVESIHQVNGDDGFTLESILTDTDSEEMMLERISLRQAIKKLPDKERMVVSMRYFHGLTQQRVSMILGVSQVQVSRLEKRAINLLKEFMS